MDNVKPIINLRTVLIWESITGMAIKDYTTNESDVDTMKYASYISGGGRGSFASFQFQYGSYDFKTKFDNEFFSSMNYFNSYGMKLLEKYATIELIIKLMSEYHIDYETIVSKMTFHEIKMILNHITK